MSVSLIQDGEIDVTGSSFSGAWILSEDRDKDEDMDEDEEEWGEFGYSSGVLESALVQTDSIDARPLQLADTEEVTSLGELEFLLLLTLRFFVEDLLGGSVKWKLSEAFGELEETGLCGNVSDGLRFLEM